MDRGGFILPRGVTHASERGSKAVAALVEKLPLRPVSLAGDSGYSDGRLRQLLEERNITAYIPIHTRHETSMVSTGEFVYHGDHLVCPQGKVLRRGSFHNPELAEGRTYQYVARQRDCQACPVKEDCLPAEAETAVLHPDDVLSRLLNNDTAPSATVRQGPSGCATHTTKSS